jgi:hypothetical protein
MYDSLEVKGEGEREGAGSREEKWPKHCMHI